MPDLEPFTARSPEHLRLVIESGHIGIWELDLATGRAVRNFAHDEIFGYSEPLDEWTYDLFLEHVAPDDRERVDELQKAAIAQQQEWAFDCEIRTADGGRRWIFAAGRPLLGEDGKPARLIGHVIDISEAKQREKRLALLTDELNHRVRNMLSVIKSIVRLSSRKAADIPSFAKALEGRVGALARSHQLLVSDDSAAMGPSEILDAELAAFPDLADRISVEITREHPLSGATGQGLALIFHELLTNALKYGSLSNDDGRVTVQIDQQDGELQIAWRESGGPKVEESNEAGFGSLLIADALGSMGRVNIRFPQTGVECDIVIPV